MARRDYKQRPRPSPNKPAGPRSPWPYFAVGMLTGVAASVLVYFNEFVPVPLYVSPKATPQQKSVEQKPKTKAEESNAPKPRFEFYTLLPEMEVAVPDTIQQANRAPASTC